MGPKEKLLIDRLGRDIQSSKERLDRWSQKICEMAQAPTRRPKSERQREGNARMFPIQIDHKFEREAVFQHLAVCFLKINKVCYFDTSSLAVPGGVYSTGQPGVPDIIVLKGYRFIAFELKSSKGKPTGTQEIMGETIISNGGEYHVVYSIKEIADVLEIGY